MSTIGLLKQVLQRLDGIDERLDDLERRVSGNGLAGTLRHIELEVQAVQRHLRVVGRGDLTPNARLVAKRFKGSSQNEEDGVTLAIFEEAGVVDATFVELGCGSNGGNSGHLARELGWTGLMVDTDPGLVAQARRANPSGIVPITAWVTRDNVNDLVREHGPHGEVDLLSVDIDGNDLWIWLALEACRPRVVITEYNSIFGAQRAVSVPYSADFDRHRERKLQRVYYGASLRAFHLVALRRGYRLVAVEPRGVNAFWVREDVAPALPAVDPGEAYRLLEKHQRELARLGGDVFTVLEERELELVDVEDWLTRQPL